MTSILFKDKNEIYYRDCDVCGKTPGCKYLHWNNKDFTLCVNCLESLFFQYIVPEIKQGEQIKVKRATIPESLRDEIFKRDKNQCKKCGSNYDLCIDHKIPFAIGGSTEKNNLQTLCRKCNVTKGARLDARQSI